MKIIGAILEFYFLHLTMFLGTASIAYGGMSYIIGGQFIADLTAYQEPLNLMLLTRSCATAVGGGMCLAWAMVDIGKVTKKTTALLWPEKDEDVR